MDAQEFKVKLLDHKIAAVSAIIAVAAVVTTYVRQDSITTAAQALHVAEEKVNILRYNQQHGGQALATDLKAMESFYDQVSSRALDFESGIATQSFFSDLIQARGVKVDGIPSISGQPVSNVKPFACGAYFIQGSGSSGAILEFARKCEEHQAKGLRVDRIQLTAGEVSATTTSTTPAPADLVIGGLALRSWGYRSEVGLLKPTQPVVGAKLEKVAVTRVVRQQKLQAASAAMSKRVDLSAVNHLLGASSGVVVDSGSAMVAAIELELKALKIIGKRIFGQQAIAGDKIGTKRVGNSFDLVVGGVTYKVTLKDVTTEFATFSVLGKMIKMPIGN